MLLLFIFQDELFRLVVGKGGLVEVINKKLWREVTKGLNLPSSITSAAFTLRTQYVSLRKREREKNTCPIINLQLSIASLFLAEEDKC